MQPRGWRRHRSLRAREHGLIVRAVALIRLAPRGDIGRQRHFATFLHGLIEYRPVERERQPHLPALAFLLYGRIELAEEADLALVAEAHHVARHEPLRRAHEGTPTRAVEPLMQGRLDRRFVGTAPDAAAVQARRYYLRVVDDDCVAGSQQVG